MSLQSILGGMMLATDTPVRVEIVNPVTRQPLIDINGQPAYVEVLSNNSDVARRHEKESMDRRLAMKQRKMTSDDLTADTNALIAKLVRSWHLVGFDGKPIDFPCNESNVRSLIELPSMKWWVEQISEHIGDRSNFLAVTAKKG